MFQYGWQTMSLTVNVLAYSLLDLFSARHVNSLKQKQFLLPNEF